MRQWKGLVCLFTICLLCSCAAASPESSLTHAETTAPPPESEAVSVNIARFEFDGITLTVKPFSSIPVGNMLSAMRLETETGAAYDWISTAAYAWFAGDDAVYTRDYTQPVCKWITGLDGERYCFYYHKIVNGMQGETPACLLLREEKGALVLVRDLNTLTLDLDIARVEAVMVDLAAAEPRTRMDAVYEATEEEMAQPLEAQIAALTASFADILAAPTENNNPRFAVGHSAYVPVEGAENNFPQFITTYRLQSEDYGLAATELVTPGEGSRPALTIEGWGYGERFEDCAVRDLDGDGADEIMYTSLLEIGYRLTKCHIFTVLRVSADGTLTPVWSKAMDKQDAEAFLPLFRETNEWFVQE